MALRACTDTSPLREPPMGYVLIVEDMPAVREPIALVLQRAGFATRTAANGREALDLIGAERPDLVILDLAMPVMDGPALLRELRARPATADLPVIVMTATTDRESVIEAGKLGVRDYLIKSQFKLTDLVARVTRYVKPTGGDGGGSPAPPA
jgi:DNA-binding response OmpR family regulator